MLAPGSFALTLLLAMLTGIGPLSVDMYLASLPDIGRLLAAPPAQVQLTISLYLIGFASAQVFYGPLSDRHGRRPVLIVAIAVYLLATLACAIAPTIETLMAGRFFQAIGASGTIVLARAVVRDMYEGARVAREMSRIAAIMALAPLIAPLFGGVLQTLFGWRSNFVLLLAVGAIAAAMIWFLLPETLRRRTPEPVSVVSILRSYQRFLGHPGFVACLGISICCMGGLFAWISIGAFVLQDIYGLTPLLFGVAFAVAALGYLIGTLIGARYVSRWGSDRCMGFGAIAMAAGGIMLVLVVASGWWVAVGLVLAIGLYLGGMGLTWPQAQAGALLPFPDRAGAASSLLGFLTQTCSAIVGAILGHLMGSTAWPLAIAVAVAGVGAVALWAATRDMRKAAI